MHNLEKYLFYTSTHELLVAIVQSLTKRTVRKTNPRHGVVRSMRSVGAITNLVEHSTLNQIHFLNRVTPKVRKLHTLHDLPMVRSHVHCGPTPTSIKATAQFITKNKSSITSCIIYQHTLSFLSCLHHVCTKLLRSVQISPDVAPDWRCTASTV